MQEGVDVSVGDEQDTTTLLCAIRKDKTECTRLLIELGADVNAADEIVHL